MTLGPGRNKAAGEVASMFVGQIPPFVMGWLPMPRFDRDHMGIFHPDVHDTVGPLSPLMGFGLWVVFAFVGYGIVFERVRKVMNRAPEYVAPVRAKRRREREEEWERR
jgi:hypothetical protein